jgi:hypothetical protein
MPEWNGFRVSAGLGNGWSATLPLVFVILSFQGFDQSWNGRSPDVVSVTATITIELKFFLTFQPGETVFNRRIAVRTGDRE